MNTDQPTDDPYLPSRVPLKISIGFLLAMAALWFLGTHAFDNASFNETVNSGLFLGMFVFALFMTIVVWVRTVQRHEELEKEKLVMKNVVARADAIPSSAEEVDLAFCEEAGVPGSKVDNPLKRKPTGEKASDAHKLKVEDDPERMEGLTNQALTDAVAKARDLFTSLMGRVTELGLTVRAPWERHVYSELVHRYKPSMDDPIIFAVTPEGKVYINRREALRHMEKITYDIGLIRGKLDEYDLANSPSTRINEGEKLECLVAKMEGRGDQVKLERYQHLLDKLADKAFKDGLSLHIEYEHNTEGRGPSNPLWSYNTQVCSLSELFKKMEETQ